MGPRLDKEITRFLSTGEYDSLPSGQIRDLVEASKQAKHSMREALITEVSRRATGMSAPRIPVIDLRAFSRSKVAPMVQGLFPAAEQANIVDVLEKSVVFLAADTIDETLRRSSWLSTAWTLANLYLLSIGAELLNEKAPRLVGLSEETTCYVSHDYFEQRDRFADFVVHEAAHVFTTANEGQWD